MKVKSYKELKWELVFYAIIWILVEVFAKFEISPGAILIGIAIYYFIADAIPEKEPKFEARS